MIVVTTSGGRRMVDAGTRPSASALLALARLPAGSAGSAAYSSGVPSNLSGAVEPWGGGHDRRV